MAWRLPVKQQGRFTTHTYIDTYTHTHIHTYIHTYIHTATEDGIETPSEAAGPDSPRHTLRAAPTAAQASRAFAKLFDTSWVDAQVCGVCV